MAEWLRTPVATLQAGGALLVEDGNHGENRPRREEFVRDGMAFVRAADMQSGRVLFTSASHINASALGRIRKGIGKPGDVLLSHKGTVGKVAWVGEDCPAFVCSPQTTFYRVRDASRIDRRYLYFYLQSPGFQRLSRSSWNLRWRSPA
jgi:type I restriction enzyme S subunit